MAFRPAAATPKRTSRSTTPGTCTSTSGCRRTPVRFPIGVPALPGIDPCPQLEERGGIWRFKADVVGQKYSKDGALRVGHAPARCARVARRDISMQR